MAKHLFYKKSSAVKAKKMISDRLVTVKKVKAPKSWGVKSAYAVNVKRR
jgi:hypothetical protein